MIPPHFVLHVAQKHRLTKEGEEKKTERKGEEEERKLV